MPYNNTGGWWGAEKIRGNINVKGLNVFYVSVLEQTKRKLLSDSQISDAI